ncbi:MobF family relaxase [Xanthomonas albilineans]|uniref:MobF family relaxase n=1 Tax=Xanthomonas albilineans TaxID=29447 RepID=UPI0009BA1BB7|nr:MobF family relaxase [Xanthomonas albilineans]
MLNVTPIRGANNYAASHYFASGDDYYTKEHSGQWQGQGAEALGLQANVDQAQFSRLLNGQLPNGERIHATFNADENKKRMGIDLTFSAPKSVSMQALVGGDKRVLAAHDLAVTRAVQEVEKLAEARKKVAGKSSRERTGNMVVAKFRHEMSRAKDPQLHTHAVVLNMTQRSDRKWRALANEDIFRAQHEIGGIYMTELAKELRALGYEIRMVDDRGNFELDHISRKQIEAFSGRSKVIEEALQNQGKTRATATTLEKQVISLATRPRKDERDREIIKQWWVEKSRELAIDYGANSPVGNRSYLAAQSLPRSMTPAQAVVQYAIRHLTEREAVVTHGQLVATALHRAVGLTDSHGVKAEIRKLVQQGALIEASQTYRLADKKDGQAHTAEGWRSYVKELKGWNDAEARSYVRAAIERGGLVPTERRYTTHRALKREKAILAIERAGRGQLTPILTATAAVAALELHQLDGDQRAAIEAIVTSPNRFVGIQGDAGTGKTYTVEKAVEMIQQKGGGAEGWRVLALAPYGNQVKALKNEGLDAHTLASFLHTKNKPIDGRTVVILDEAAVVGARQMEQVMRLVEQHGARMVLLGDTKQTEAIEAGKPFAQLQKAGMQTARIHKIQRQTDPELKKAVELAAAGRAGDSLAQLRHVEEIQAPTDRRSTIVADYMRLPENERQQTLIVSGTNEARREINGKVREALDLLGKGRTFDTLTRVDMTQAQRRYAPSYQQGMVVQPERDYASMGLARGETYRVSEARPGNVLVLVRPDQSTVEVNPRKVTQLSVYRQERSELAVGDTVRINRNNPSLDLTNGDRLRVAGVVGGIIKLESFEQKDGRPAKVIELPANKPLHMEYSYASTIHSAQGLTNQRALIEIDTKSRTTSMNLYYVAISRAREEARVYTNNRGGLPQAIARRFDKTTALGLERDRNGMKPPNQRKPREYGRFE